MLPSSEHTRIDRTHRPNMLLTTVVYRTAGSEMRMAQSQISSHSSLGKVFFSPTNLATQRKRALAIRLHIQHGLVNRQLLHFMHLRKNLKKFQLKSRQRPKVCSFRFTQERTSCFTAEHALSASYAPQKFCCMLRHEENLCLFVIAFWGYVSTQCMYSWPARTLLSPPPTHPTPPHPPHLKRCHVECDSTCVEEGTQLQGRYCRTPPHPTASRDDAMLVWLHVCQKKECSFKNGFVPPQPAAVGDDATQSAAARILVAN